MTVGTYRPGPGYAGLRRTCTNKTKYQCRHTFVCRLIRKRPISIGSFPYAGLASAKPACVSQHDPTQGHPPDTSPRSCCGPAGLDVGPQQFPKPANNWRKDRLVSTLSRQNLGLGSPKIRSRDELVGTMISTLIETHTRQPRTTREVITFPALSPHVNPALLVVSRTV